MSFTFAQLKTAIQDYTDNSETSFVNHLSDFIKAAEAFKQAIAVKGVTDVTALNILATMHIAAGRFDLGIEMLNRVIDKSIKTAQHLKGNEIYNYGINEFPFLWYCILCSNCMIILN